MGIFFSPINIAKFLGAYVSVFQAHPTVPNHQAVPPRNTAEDFPDLFPKLTTDEILIGACGQLD